MAIQEMLQLELICNICNALGYTPRFHPPRYSEAHRIPFIHPRQEALPRGEMSHYHKFSLLLHHREKLP